jgi:hypothetical protein
VFEAAIKTQKTHNNCVNLISKVEATVKTGYARRWPGGWMMKPRMIATFLTLLPLAVLACLPAEVETVQRAHCVADTQQVFTTGGAG